MNIRSFWLYLVFVLFICSRSVLAIEPYEFPDEEARRQFQQLTFELRCPKCQNQNIADSNAPIAKDLRREVHRMVLEGKHSDEIVAFMVERYGDFVRYRPPVSVQTIALWTAPVIFVLIGLVVAFRLGAGRKKSSADNGALTAAEKERLKELLQENPDTEEIKRGE